MLPTILSSVSFVSQYYNVHTAGLMEACPLSASPNIQKILVSVEPVSPVILFPFPRTVTIVLTLEVSRFCALILYTKPQHISYGFYVLHSCPSELAAECGYDHLHRWAEAVSSSTIFRNSVTSTGYDLLITCSCAVLAPLQLWPLGRWRLCPPVLSFITILLAMVLTFKLSRGSKTMDDVTSRLLCGLYPFSWSLCRLKSCFLKSSTTSSGCDLWVGGGYVLFSFF